MTEGKKERYRPRLGIGVFLLCLGLMLFELSLTRVLSVLYYYHTAFLAISVAMLGLGAGGLGACLFGAQLSRHRNKVILGSALAMGLLPLLLPIIELDVVDLEEFFGAPFLLSISITMLVTLLPFIGGGAVLALIFQEHQDKVGKLYALDLIGAALGAILLVPAMEYLGGVGALYLSGVLVAWASMLLFGRSKSSAIGLVLMAMATVLVAFFGMLPMRLEVDADDPNAKILRTEWNAFSRVVALDHKSWDRGLSAERMELRKSTMPKQIDALIDINAYAPMVEFDGDLSKVSYLSDLVSNLGYWTRETGFDVAIIGPGGGKDVLGALLFEPQSVTAIEINPILAKEFVGGQFKEFTGDIYDHEKVSLIVGDGRSELRNLERRFDIIVANSVATWAAHSSGAMNLTESSLFTIEAFREYRDRLVDDGILSVSLWDEADHSLPLRLIESWHQVNGSEHELKDCVAVIGNRWSGDRWFTNVLMSRAPWSDTQKRALTNAARDLDFDVVYLGGEGKPQFAEYFRDPDQFIEDCRYNIQASTDDRPFFFYSIRFGEALRIWDRNARTDNAAWFSLVASFLLLTLIVVGLIGVPLLWLRKKNGNPIGVGLRESLCFCSIGAAFMLVEVSLIQRLTLFLGHPTFALTVVLSGLLAWSGLGSFLANHFSARIQAAKLLKVVLFSLSLLCIPIWFLIPQASDGIFLVATWMKIAITLALLAPLGILMGMPMPLALTLVGTRNAASIPWAWGLNGAMGVLASVAALIIAITSGFAVAFGLGGVFYLVAVLVWPFECQSR